MRTWAAAKLVLLVCIGFGGLARAEDVPPVWAYPVNPAFKPTPDDGQMRHVPDSALVFSVAQTRDPFFTSDWHPEDHPPMPEIVAIGRKPDVFACGFCHRADGPGGPESASLAGLSAAYITEQMAKFKDGSRSSSLQDRSPVRLMTKAAKAASDADVQAAAAYFSALPPKAVVKVVETDTVPMTMVVGPFLADAKSGQSEPIGRRIIEVPEDLAQFENRDSRAHFIAYVPVGSTGKGAALATNGGGNSVVQCVGCHGLGLSGADDIPPLAGRSPSYLVRQLYDFKLGARTGSGTELMKTVAQAMTDDDMINVAAYAASLQPKAAAAR